MVKPRGEFRESRCWEEEVFESNITLFFFLFIFLKIVMNYIFIIIFLMKKRKI